MRGRESLGSRLGFILISAGCAIGLGNVWRFPYIAGQHGGGAFVLMYLFFLIMLALPIMVMEFSVGRASRANVAASFLRLAPGTRWHWFGLVALLGNYLLMMFYTTVTGWTLAYCWYFLRGDFSGLSTDAVGALFDGLLADPYAMTFWMGLCVVLGFSICAVGLRRGVERVTTLMMSGLFVILLILVGRSLSLEGALEGLRFYLLPDWSRMAENGPWKGIFAAMGQAFFTLSIGIGSMAIFGSYIGKERSLTGEAVSIMALDTSVALLAGLIIFPACFAFGVFPGSGPGLVFITLPSVFSSMPGSIIWGTLFFAFMSFAALTTVVAVFENIVSFGIDVLGWSRKKTCAVNGVIVFLASLPCVLGFNVLEHIQPLGSGSNILGLEDFLVSDNILPLGALVYLLFCCTRYGWGWENFLAEADAGRGLKFPRFLRPYLTYVLPAIMILVFLRGYAEKFFSP